MTVAAGTAAEDCAGRIAATKRGNHMACVLKPVARTPRTPTKAIPAVIHLRADDALATVNFGACTSAGTGDGRGGSMTSRVVLASAGNAGSDAAATLGITTGGGGGTANGEGVGGAGENDEGGVGTTKGDDEDAASGEVSTENGEGVGTRKGAADDGGGGAAVSSTGAGASGTRAGGISTIGAKVCAGRGLRGWETGDSAADGGPAGTWRTASASNCSSRRDALAYMAPSAWRKKNP